MGLIRPNRIGRRWLGPAQVTPKALFGNAENGVFYDFSDIRSLYTDAAGTTPVTAPDTPIRLAADKSRIRSPITAYAQIQANTGLAPRWGRAPKSRRQKLLQSGNMMSGAWWPVSGVLVTLAAEVLDGQPFFDLAKTDDSTSRPIYGLSNHSVAGESYTFTLALLAGTSNTAEVGIGAGADGGGGIWGGASTSYAILSGPATAVSLSGLIRVANLSATVPTVVRVTRTYTNAGVQCRAYIYPGTSSSTVPGASVKAAKPQLEVGVVGTNYQLTTTAFDMTEAGVPSFGYARWDMTDDITNTVLTLAQTGDVLLFGRNGSWIEPGRVFAGGASLTMGVTGSGLTANILRVLGDIVGIVAIGRTLATDERNRALKYFQAAGAAGWLTPGAELSPNVGFDSGTGWTDTSTGTGAMSISGGQMTLTGVDVSNRGKASLAQITGVVIGTPYLVRWDVVSGTAHSQVTAASGGTVLDVYGASSPGSKQAVFVAGATTIDLSFNVYGAGAVAFDNISIKPLTAGA